MKIDSKKKIGIIVALSSISCAAIITGVLATFNATTESYIVAAAGTVQVELSGIELTNYKNITPGDNDPSIVKNAADGTSHKVQYSISNVGTKSIKTRQTIILTANDKDSSKKLLDARYLKLFDGKKELEDKTYILSNGKEVEKLKENQQAIAVKYVFYGDSFNGSENAYVVPKEDSETGEIYYIIESESDNADESFVLADENGDVNQEYEFNFALLESAPNSYQGADINIYVAVEALQYRNSLEEDWTDAATVYRGFSTNKKLAIDSLPSFVEDPEGNEIELNVSELEAAIE